MRSDAERTTYGFCLDNVQFSTEAKHCTSENHNHFELLTMCFAVKSRVPRPLTAAASSTTAAVNLDPYSFLPSPQVVENVRIRMAFEVSHILTRHLPFLQHLKKKLEPSIPHQHSKEMMRKSELVGNS